MKRATIHRALTLVEVLAATVILAALIMACMPWLTAVHQAARTQSDSSILRELSEFADGVIADPDAAGIEPLDTIHMVTVDWHTSHSDGARQVAIRRLDMAQGQEQPPDHAWLAFEHQSATVLRWIKLPPPSPGSPSERSP